MAGDLDASAHLVEDVGKGDVQVGGLRVQLDVREHVSELHGAYWVAQVAGLERDAQSVSVVHQGGTAGYEVGHAADADGVVATGAVDELAVGEDAVEQADSVGVGSVQGWVGEDDLDWDEGDHAWCAGHAWSAILTVLTVLASGSHWTGGAHGAHSPISTSGSHRSHWSSIALGPPDGLEADLTRSEASGRHEAKGQQEAEASENSTHLGSEKR